MKILLITCDTEDYLSDMILHGLRQLPELYVVDYPKKNQMYKSFPSKVKLYGLGFSLYRTLNDLYIDRTNILSKIQNSYFDLIIFSSIHRQFGIYYQLYPYLKKTKTIVLDGEDDTAIFPYLRYYYNKPYYWFIPKPHKHFLYFKREWTPKTIANRWYKMLPKSLASKIRPPKNLRKISFAIPEQKIIKELPKKTKLFPAHIVDKEIAKKVNNSTSYLFDNENDYYADIQTSKFGITTKKGGWDCMRHYEIAANGSVICFRDLDKKPQTCAPHGLNSTNCIIYSDYNDLIKKINNLSENEYKKLQNQSINWIKNNTTKTLAQKLIFQIQ